MSRWTEEEDGALLKCIEEGLTAEEASVFVKRSPSACAGRAQRLGAGFNSAPNAGLRQFLKEGGRLIREDLGGVIGVRWARAHRSASGFATPICERFLELGLIRAADEGRTYVGAQP